MIVKLNTNAELVHQDPQTHTIKMNFRVNSSLTFINGEVSLLKQTFQQPAEEMLLLHHSVPDLM